MPLTLSVQFFVSKIVSWLSVVCFVLHVPLMLMLIVSCVLVPFCRNFTIGPVTENKVKPSKVKSNEPLSWIIILALLCGFNVFVVCLGLLAWMCKCVFTAWLFCFTSCFLIQETQSNSGTILFAVEFYACTKVWVSIQEIVCFFSIRSQQQTFFERLRVRLPELVVSREQNEGRKLNTISLQVYVLVATIV